MYGVFSPLAWLSAQPHFKGGMKQNMEVWVNDSQSPEKDMKDWLECLRSRTMVHKFLYESSRQAARWLEVHRAFSPARTDQAVLQMYGSAFTKVAEGWRGSSVQLIGLGCGGGHKEVQLALALESRRHKVRFLAADASLPLVLSARHRFAAVMANPAQHIVSGWVLDIAEADLVGSLEELAGSEKRLITFFGMVPNFEPDIIFPRLASLLREGDQLLLSANLAPGPDYRAGVERILPLYDNSPTRRWLIGPLEAVGVSEEDARVDFSLVSRPPHGDLIRVQADLTFLRKVAVESEGEVFEYDQGQVFQLFYSYRHTPENLASTLGQYGLKIEKSWVAPSGEEGLFLLGRF